MNVLRVKKLGVFLLIISFCVLVGCNNSIEYKEIKEIYYSRSSFGVISEEIVVNLEKKEVRKFYNSEFGKGGRPMTFDEISPEEYEIYKIKNVARFEENLQKSGINKWKDEYVNRDIMDGYQWSMRIVFRDGTERKIYGSNKKPKNFDKVISAINDYDN